MHIIFALTLGLLTAVGGAALAQDKGTVNPKPLPPLANPDDPKTPAKELFGRRHERAVYRILLARLSRWRRSPAH